MRTTVDLPDESYLRAKAEAAVRGCNFNDLVEEGLRHLLRGPNPRPRQSDQPGPPSHDLMRDFCGIAKDARADYATNQNYREG
jgi:hypothetical protein